jgi:hypothetical protein
MFFQDTEGGLIRESTDLIGASVFGIGGEEKLVDLVKGRKQNEYQVSVNSNDLALIKDVRKGDASAPFFIQVGGNYFIATAKKGSQSDIVLINHQPERLNKKQALEMLKSYQASKKDIVATQTI